MRNLGVHYPRDVVAEYAAGATWLGFSMFILPAFICMQDNWRAIRNYTIILCRRFWDERGLSSVFLSGETWLIQFFATGTLFACYYVCSEEEIIWILCHKK